MYLRVQVRQRQTTIKQQESIENRSQICKIFTNLDRQEVVKYNHVTF